MTAPPKTASARRAWATLGLLAFLYVMSFVDRSIPSLLVRPLKAEFDVSDLALGLMFGPAFAIFYAFLALPMARLVDHGNRCLLIVAGVMLWGAVTVGSGLANTFGVLVAMRIGLAVGEAVLTPGVYSLIGDIFPQERRALAASIYTGVGVLGAGGSYVLGAGVIAGAATLARLGAMDFAAWRLTFIVVGLPTIVLALFFLIFAREPARRSPTADHSLRAVLGFLRSRWRVLLPLGLGAGLIQTTAWAWLAWGPEFISRAFSLPIPRVGLMFGLINMSSGCLGAIAAPLLTSYLDRGPSGRSVAKVSLAFSVIAAVSLALATMVSSLPILLLLVWVGTFCVVAASNNIVVATQTLVPAEMRATLVSLILFSITMLGVGGGPWLTAALSDQLSRTGAALGDGLAVTGGITGIAAALCFVAAHVGLKQRSFR